MSSILDALNKSEAERQRGQPPGLNTPMPFSSTRPPPRRRPWLLPLVAIAALGLAWAGGLFDFGGDRGEDEAAQVAAPATPEDAAPEDAAGDPAVTAAAPATQPQPTEPVAATEPVLEGSGFGPRQATPEDVADTASPDTATTPDPAVAATAPAEPRRRVFGPAGPMSGPDADPTGQAQAEAAAGQAEAAERERALAEAQTQTEAAPAPAPGQPADTTATPAAPATSAPSQTSGANVVAFNDLPFATRQSLPEIMVTMHVYSTDPGRRVVMINGRRAQDGDELEGGIVVRSILPDGVVIGYQDNEFLLPTRQ